MEAFEAVYSLEKVFPQGVKILAVDDHVVCLRVLEAQLKHCGYIVTVTQNAETALNLLRENKNSYDLVITNVNMPDMDGFRLLEIIDQEMDLPVIMFSANGDTNYVMKATLLGAVDYLVKPLRVEQLKIIWKHIIKKRTKKDPFDNSGRKINDQTSKAMTNHVEEKEEETAENSNSNEAPKEEGSVEDLGSNEAPRNKRSRFTWTPEMHTKFVAAYNLLGHERATPKRILEHMNVEGLTRYNIASHLQKHRQGLKKNGQGTRPQHTIYGFGATRQMPFSQHQNLHNNHNLVANFESFRSSHDLLPLPNNLRIPLSSQLGMRHAAYSSNLGQQSGSSTLGYSIPNCVTNRIEGSMNNFVQAPWNGSGVVGAVPIQMQRPLRQEDHSNSFFDYKTVESFLCDDKSPFGVDIPVHYQGVSSQPDIVPSMESSLQQNFQMAPFQHFRPTHGRNNEV